MQTKNASRANLTRRFIVPASCIALMLIFSGSALKTSPRSGSSPITICRTSFSVRYDSTIAAKVLPGLGDLHYRITTKDSLAQTFFDQGLRLIYGFNHVEALRSFQEASKLDPGCAMAYWGQALTLGPNINDWNPKDRESMALAAISKARKLSARGPAKEIEFINALAARFDGKPHDNRDPLNQAYKLSMKALANKYPDDPEALVLYADAIMNSMPWDYWNKDGSPKMFTTDAKTALEAALQKYPNHPGAHHLYIHLVEASNSPFDARKSAEFLETAMPGAGHIVHMPSHIYARVGEYEKSNNSNQQAIRVDEEYLAQSADSGLYRMAYYPHNIDFLGYGSLMNGRSAQAIMQGNKTVSQIKAMEATMLVMYDFFLSVPIATLVRFGKWDEILALPSPDKRYLQTTAIHSYALGTALLRKGRVAEAEKEWKKLDSISRLDTLRNSYAFYNSTQQILRVPSLLLKGELLIRNGKVQRGIESLKEAVAAEDGLRYNEPPDWRLPSRHFLGAALAEAGLSSDAVKIYEDDLRVNPDNGWALFGLMTVQRTLGKNAEADNTFTRYQRAWEKADVVMHASRY